MEHMSNKWLHIVSGKHISHSCMCPNFNPLAGHGNSSSFNQIEHGKLHVWVIKLAI